MDQNLISKVGQAITEACSIHFAESNFALKLDLARFVISGDVISKAQNHYRQGQAEVNVLKWFDDFWVYMETNLVFSDHKKEFPRIFVSISIFQGEMNDIHKTQLFRAEWDNYENNRNHAQPHWHLYPYKYHHEIYEDFEAFNDMKNEGFEQLANDNFKKIVDLRKIHFAMNAEWAKRLTAIHELSDINILKNWLHGLFGDIRFQITHALGA